ncbi:MAG: LysR substrate-binding domain-containing protein, partial [Pseudomonas neustonica]
TQSRSQAWADWARLQQIDPAKLTQGQGFEHLYYLLEAALSGLGVAIAPQLLVADDLATGRLLAPWGFVETQHQLGLWVPARQPQGAAQQLADWLIAQMQESSI